MLEREPDELLLQLGQPFAKLELQESCALYGVFDSLSEQLIAYQNQPRFKGAAFELLEEMSETLCRQMRELVAHIKMTKASSKIEREIRAKILITDSMLDTDDISEIAAVAASLAVTNRH